MKGSWSLNSAIQFACKRTNIHQSFVCKVVLGRYKYLAAKNRGPLLDSVDVSALQDAHDIDPDTPSTLNEELTFLMVGSDLPPIQIVRILLSDAQYCSDVDVGNEGRADALRNFAAETFGENGGDK